MKHAILKTFSIQLIILYNFETLNNDRKLMRQGRRERFHSLRRTPLGILSAFGSRQGFRRKPLERGDEAIPGPWGPTWTGLLRFARDDGRELICRNRNTKRASLGWAAVDRPVHPSPCPLPASGQRVQEVPARFSLAPLAGRGQGEGLIAAGPAIVW